jgi:hypothetical protein
VGNTLEPIFEELNHDIHMADYQAGLLVEFYKWDPARSEAVLYAGRFESFDLLGYLPPFMTPFMTAS